MYFKNMINHYCDLLWARQSRDRMPVEAGFYAPVQTGSGAHLDNCTLVIEFLSWE